MRRRVSRFGLFAVMALVVMAFAATVTAAQKTVRIEGLAFTPAQVTLAPGDTIVWMNAHDVAHTAVLDTGAFNSGPIPPGTASTPLTFTAPGEFSYHCDIVPDMKGTISVRQAAAPGPTSPPLEPPPTDALSDLTGGAAPSAAPWVLAMLVVLAAAGVRAAPRVFLARRLALVTRQPRSRTAIARLPALDRARSAPVRAISMSTRLDHAVATDEPARVTGSAPWAMTIAAPPIRLPDPSDTEGEAPEPVQIIAERAEVPEPPTLGDAAPGADASGAGDAVPAPVPAVTDAPPARVTRSAAPARPSSVVLAGVLVAVIVVAAIARRSRP